jgi:hypothetical protein
MKVIIIEHLQEMYERDCKLPVDYFKNLIKIEVDTSLDNKFQRF